MNKLKPKVSRNYETEGKSSLPTLAATAEAGTESR